MIPTVRLGHSATNDTMKGGVGGSVESGQSARVHGIRLRDKGSCCLPEYNYTITIEEWRRQQARAAA